MLTELAVIFVALALGGLLKGATGAGAPIFAVPAMAAAVDVRFAIVVMLVPNLVSNAWQIWLYRNDRPPSRFLVPLLVMAGIGAAIGTWLLTALAAEALLVTLALVVYGYVALRLARPHFAVSMAAATRLAAPVGLISGILQGAAGVSAPVSITFLNAMRLSRPVFILSISLLFEVMVVVQIPSLTIAGLVTPERALYSVLALIPVTLAMTVGGVIGKRMSPQTFDRVILIALSLIATKLLFDALV